MAAIIINIAPTICLPFNTSPKIKKANILDRTGYIEDNILVTLASMYSVDFI